MWAVKWCNGSLLGKFCADHKHPTHFDGYTTMVFRTRKEAAAFIKKRWGYIATRPDLRRDPHGWRVPKPVRVTVQVTET